MKKRLALSLTLIFVFGLAVTAKASYIGYQIIFAPNFGIEGSFFIDDSIISSNQTYDTWMPTGLLRDFVINYGGGVYNYDPVATQSAVVPSFPYVIATGSDGQVLDIKGRLKMAGTLNEFFLGREDPGTFQYIQQYNSANSGLAFTGTYRIERISEPVPIPGAVWLLGFGLIGIIGARKKLKH